MFESYWKTKKKKEKRKKFTVAMVTNDMLTRNIFKAFYSAKGMIFGRSDGGDSDSEILKWVTNGAMML